MEGIHEWRVSMDGGYPWVEGIHGWRVSIAGETLYSFHMQKRTIQASTVTLWKKLYPKQVHRAVDETTPAPSAESDLWHLQSRGVKLRGVSHLVEEHSNSNISKNSKSIYRVNYGPSCCRSMEKRM